MNMGVDLSVLSPSELARQTLVIYAEHGEAAAAAMDRLEKFDRDIEEDEDPEFNPDVPPLDVVERADGGLDNLTMPEGMSLREGSMGVIP